MHPHFMHTYMQRTLMHAIVIYTAGDTHVLVTAVVDRADIRRTNWQPSLMVRGSSRCV